MRPSGLFLPTPPSQMWFIQNSMPKGWISETPQASLFHLGLCQSSLQQQTRRSLPKRPMFPNGTLAKATTDNCYRTKDCFTQGCSQQSGAPRGYFYQKQTGKESSRRYWGTPYSLAAHSDFFRGPNTEVHEFMANKNSYHLLKPFRWALCEALFRHHFI